jgi:hypothetical protein
MTVTLSSDRRGHNVLCPYEEQSDAPGSGVTLVGDIEIFGFVEVKGFIAGLLGPFEFGLEGMGDPILYSLSTVGVNGVGDIGVKLHSTFHVLLGALVLQLRAAVIAVFGTEVILAAASFAVVAHFSRRHCDKEAIGTLDDLDIANNELVVEGHRAEGLEPLILILDHFDSNFGDLHSLASRKKLPSIVAYYNACAAGSFFDKLSNMIAFGFINIPDEDIHRRTAAAETNRTDPQFR